MKNEELKTLKELIDSFDNNHYEEENDKLQQQIDNIRMGRPLYEGIYDRISSNVIPQNQREKEIKRLQNKIKDNKAKKKELGQALSQLRIASDKLERLAEQDLLLDTIHRLLRSRYSKEMTDADIYKKNDSKYYKLYLSSIKPITHSQNKISKEMYEIIKKNLNERAHETIGGYESIERSFKNNNINLNINKKDTTAPGYKIFNDFQKDYAGGITYSPEIARLGVDVSTLEYATKQIKGELDSSSLTVYGQDAFEKVKNIELAQKSKIETKGRYSHLIEIKEKYNRIIEISRETWYLEQILSAFSDTVINQTELYKGLRALVRELELEISKLSRETDKLYEKTGLQNKIDLIEQLEELYRQIEELNIKIEQYKNMGNEKQVDLLKQEYYNVRYEMIKILKDNPDLNKPKYNIDIEKIIKQEKEMFEPEIKKVITQEEPSYRKTDEEEIFIERTVPETQIAKEPTIKPGDNVEEIPTHIQTKDEEMFVEKAYIEETGKVESLELDSNLQTFRTYHYQNYMREKVLNSDLGKLSFSAYLESVAPHLTELINIEKERERLARTIYKDYLKYYSALENKKDAIEFYEFAGNNYGISNVDVPIEYDEEYKGMMKR